MQTTKCPPQEQLKAYLSGKLLPDDSEVLETHLADCPACEQTAIGLEAEPDTLVELLQTQSDGPANGEPGSSAKQPSTDPSRSDKGLCVFPTVLGQYELLKRLGSGGMGAVYLARHQSLDKQVALKLLPALPAESGEFVLRFQREMRAAGKLDHSAIVRTTDAGVHDGVHYLVMECIEGKDLAAIARHEEKLTVADACEIVRQACMGLDHAHSKGIVHRDVKPSNLMLDRSGRVRILDFGLAQLGRWESGVDEITTVGQLMGTLDYMAPEQAERGGAVDYRADIYSMAATLFRLLTGRAPLAAAPNLTPFEKLRLLASHKPPKIRSLRGDVPEELGRIIDSMLARDPSNRPASAIHVAELLEPFSTGADLVGLLQRANASPVNNESAMDHWLQYPLESWERQRTDNDANKVANAVSEAAVPGGSNSRNRGLTWLLLATCFAFLVAGVTIVLETSKGQLVIESEADLQVKLLTVDQSGQTKEVDELQIQPGTVATRLKTGKYEITLDAASDSFAVTNGSFTIRNGQTVVAKITPKQSESVNKTSETTTDQRLDGVVYDGQTLDTWLRRLKFERDRQQIIQSLDALSALADEQMQDLIEPAIIEAAESLAGMSSEFYSISEILRKASGPGYFDAVARFLNKLPDEATKSRFLNASAISAVNSKTTELTQIQMFLDASVRLLKSTDSEVSLQTAEALRFMAGKSKVPKESALPEKVQQALIRTISACPEVTDEKFWLAHPAEFFVPSQASQPVKDELKRRALSVIATGEIGAPLWTQAMTVLNSLHAAGITLSPAEKESIRESIGKVVTVSASSRDEMLIEFSLGIQQFAAYAGAVTPLGRFYKSESAALNRMIVCLNLIQQFQMADLVKQELTSLFRSLQELPLYLPNHERFVTSMKQADTQYWLSHLQVLGSLRRDSDEVLLRTAFVHAGFLIGNSQEEIFARLHQKFQADIDLEIDQYLEALKQGNRVFSELLGMGEAIRTEKVQLAIEDYILSDFFQWPRRPSSSTEPWRLEDRELFAVWSMAAGDGFLDSYASVLKRVNLEKQKELLHLEFPSDQTLKCGAANNLDQLLDWSDAILSDESNGSSHPLFHDTLAMLTMMLVEDANISLECQQAIIDRLKSIAALNNEPFWLAMDFQESYKVTTRRSIRGNAVSLGQWDRRVRLGLPMRTEMIKRAWGVVFDDSQKDLLLVNQALAILDAGIGFEDQATLYDQDVKQRFVQWCKAKFTEATANLETSTQTVKLPEPLRKYSEPRFEASADELWRKYHRWDDQCANLTVMLLSLTQRLELQQTLAVELEALHSAVADLNISTRFEQFQVQFDQLSSTDLTKFIQHTWYLQTGALLGKDFNTLVDRPRALRVAELERRQRYIQPGDTLAIHIPQILPSSGDPPVIQADKEPPVVGVPTVVSATGTIQLPYLEPLDVKDKDLETVEAMIKNAYISGKIFNGDLLFVTVRFLMRAGEQKELRNIGAAPIPGAPKQDQ